VKKWQGATRTLLLLKGKNMKYFKRKDGSVFGKVEWIKQSIINDFKKKGYVQCDENGVPLVKPVEKKKKNDK